MSQAVALIKRGLHEVPHLMYGGVFFTLSAFGLMLSVRRHEKYGKQNRVWKRRYTVVREEDFDPSKQVHKHDRKYPLF